MAGNIGSLLALEELKKRGLVGMGETALNFGTSAIAEPIAGLSGLLSLPLGHERATQVINNTRDKLTYQPRSEMGQRMTGYVGEAMQPVAEGFEAVSSGLGDTVKDVTGSELLGTAAYTVPTAIGAAIGYKTLPKGGKGFEIGDIQSGGNKQRGTFGGVKAKNANLEMQAAAEELANRGIPPEEIWSQTGWFKGQDGKWRFEIDDSRSSFKEWNMPKNPQVALDIAIDKAMRERYGRNAYEDLGAEEYSKARKNIAQAIKAPDAESKPLSSLLEHPDIMSAYDIGEIPVYAQQGVEYQGSYMPSTDSMYLGGGTIGSKTKSPALHEIQHAIQEREGFAKGGSPKEMDSILDNERFESLAKQDDNLTKEFNDLKQRWGKAPASEIPDDVKSRTLELRKEIDKVRARGMKELQNPFSRPSWTETERYSAYKRLYGEAEARLVQERMNMTEAERKAYPPMKHMEDMLAKEGIKMDELIVRNDSGKSMSIEQQMAVDELKKRGNITPISAK